VQSLRPYQQVAVDTVRARFAWGVKRLVLVAPTGAGKTTIAAHLVAGHPGTAIVLAHRQELVYQMADRFEEHGIDCGIIMAGNPRKDRAIQVASIQTLNRRNKPPADLLLYDECHHIRAETYEATLTHYPGSKVLGMTATPWRLDRKPLGDVFEDLYVVATVRELMAQGYLCDYGGFVYEKPSLAKVKTIGGDYDAKGLSLVYQKPEIVGDIVDRWLANAKGLRTIAFFPTIEVSQLYVEKFQAAGISAEHLDYKAPKETRKAIMARVHSGETTIISNVMLLGEGIDCPELRCVILARPTKSDALYLQQVGRVFRPKADGGEARIHDHSGAIMAHGLPDDDRVYSLTEKQPQRADRNQSLKVCKTCFRSYYPPHCPVCGPDLKAIAEAEANAWASRLRAEKSIEASKAAVEVVIKRGPEAQRAHFAYLLNEAMARNYKLGWAVYRFLAKYPSAGIPQDIYREAQRSYHPKEEIPMDMDYSAAFEKLLITARQYSRAPGSAVHKFKEAYGEEAPIPWTMWRKYVDKSKNWIVPSEPAAPDHEPGKDIPF
jgi:DNA repair protein RadD